MGQTSGPLQNGVSGVGIGGQKTAYGYVGGVNGQGMNTVNGPGSNKKGSFGSKGNLHAIQIQGSNSMVPANKRVYSANRAQSLNTSGTQINSQISMQQRRRQ